MRYLHVVQAHEKYVASGRYGFFKNGADLRKWESWTIHELGDCSRLIRVDLDARAEEGKSILAEALFSAGKRLLRFDIRYENCNFEGGIKTLAATFQFEADMLHVGYVLNGDERRYLEQEAAEDTLVDIPLLVMRGDSLAALSADDDRMVKVFVPMFEHAQLFPGVTREIASPVEYVGEEQVTIGGKSLLTKRYRYRDKAVSYWVDHNNIVVKRVNSFKRDEFVVLISEYAQRH